MANNPSLFPSPSHGSLMTAPKLMPTNGDQVMGSMPNLMTSSGQLQKPNANSPLLMTATSATVLNNNPNGYSLSSASSPLLNNSVPTLQSAQFNNVYNHHSSSQSSRNSSPAMNQPIATMQQPSPQMNQFKTTQLPPSGFQQQQQQSQPPFNVTRPLLPPSMTQPLYNNIQPMQATQGVRPQPPFPTSQPINQVRSYPPPPASQLPNPNAIVNNNNQLPTNLMPPAPNKQTNIMPPTPAPNKQINLSTPPLLSSPNMMSQPYTNQQMASDNNLINPPYSAQQMAGNGQMPPSMLPPSKPNVPQFNPQTTSQALQGMYPPQSNQIPQRISRLPPTLPPQQTYSSTGIGAAQMPLVPSQPPSWNQQPPYQPQPAQGQNYNNGQSDLSQQMGRMSVTQNSFSQLWRQESVDLLQCRNVLTEEKESPPQIKLGHHYNESANCSPDIFRCTLTKIPETNNLLQKARLPFGVLIHPFKDLNHLPVIQCNSIVRCRSCRTYINPFVYFVDLKRWKCNLCYRVNDLPEEFQYDPVSKTYGEPRRRPEITSATLEYVAPSEYMLRPPQPAAYCFVMDVSADASRTGYLPLFCETLAQHINEIPGDSRTMLSFICFDHAVHFYSLRSGKPNQLTVMDIDDIFVPSPEDLLVNLAEKKSVIEELLEALPNLHASPCPSATQSALGAALLAAHKLMAPTGGRVTVFQTCLPNIGPGALTAREDPNNRSSKDVAHLNPATDFYKRLALDCSGVQVAVDLFLLNSQYADLSTLSGMSQFSGGTVYHFPLFKGNKDVQAQELKRCLTRYLTRKIGFEAVMRVRCTRGVSIHTFHGSFFVRSTDLLALPNVSPDAGFGMQLAIEENLTDVQQVCFQAAVLYTSSKGERRIRVHTMCLPVVNTLNEVIHSADQQAIVGLLCKMGVDRSLTSSLTDAREALLNAVVDALGTQKISSGYSSGLPSPMAIRLMPMYLLALLKHPAFRIGTSTRLDDRIAAMCMMKSMPLTNLMRCIYPDLYPVHNLIQYTSPQASETENTVPNPPRYHLSAEKVNANGAYLMDQETQMILYVGHKIDLEWLQNTLGVNHPSLVPPEGWHSLPVLETEENTLLHAFISQLNDEKPYASSLRIMIDTSPNRGLFIEKLLDDRVESSFSYHEFLQHIKSQIK